MFLVGNDPYVRGVAHFFSVPFLSQRPMDRYEAVDNGDVLLRHRQVNPILFKFRVMAKGDGIVSYVIDSLLGKVYVASRLRVHHVVQFLFPSCRFFRGNCLFW